MSEKKKGCGCVGKGCIVLVVIAAIFIGLAAWSYQKFVAWMRPHTSSQPAEMAGEKSTRDQYDALVKKMDAYKNAADSGQTLELTAHDLNVLIAYSPEWAAVRGKMHVSIKNDEVDLTGSLPLTFLPELRDQYLNGSIYFTPSMENNVLRLEIHNIKLKEGDLSKEEVKAFSQSSGANLTNRLLGDTVLKPLFIKTKTLKAKDGVIVLTSG